MEGVYFFMVLLMILFAVILGVLAFAIFNKKDENDDVLDNFK
ncbi:MAG: hypothetical protein RL757_1413 [Bacteroidota bacterium]|jgi:hypothetical protein